MASPSSRRATKRRRSSVTELSIHGIHTSRRKKAKSVTHVSGTKCHLCLGPLTQQNLHFPKFSSGVFVRAVGKLCAPVGKLLFRSCSVTVAARCSVAPGSGGYLVDLPSRYETRLPRWGDG